MPTKPMLPILLPIHEGTPTMAHHFSEGDYKKGIAALKNNKAANRDDVLVELEGVLGETSLVVFIHIFGMIV